MIVFLIIVRRVLHSRDNIKIIEIIEIKNKDCSFIFGFLLDSKFTNYYHI